MGMTSAQRRERYRRQEDVAARLASYGEVEAWEAAKALTRTRRKVRVSKRFDPERGRFEAEVQIGGRKHSRLSGVASHLTNEVGLKAFERIALAAGAAVVVSRA
jgi:hypothetical protein